MYPNPERMGNTSIFRSRKEASSIGRADDPSESVRDHLFEKTGKFAPSGRIMPGDSSAKCLPVALLRRAHDRRGGGRRGGDIGRGRRRCRRHHGRGRRRVLMDVDTAGETQKRQRNQQGDAHRTYPSVADNEHGLISPVSWRVGAASVAGSWPGITTGWVGAVVDCRSFSLIHVAGPEPGN